MTEHRISLTISCLALLWVLTSLLRVAASLREIEMSRLALQAELSALSVENRILHGILLRRERSDTVVDIPDTAPIHPDHT